MKALRGLFSRKVPVPSPAATPSVQPNEVTDGLRGKQHVLCWFIRQNGERDFAAAQKRSLLKDLEAAKRWLATQSNEQEAGNLTMSLTPSFRGCIIIGVCKQLAEYEESNGLYEKR
jgi:hypothetical protein